MKTGYRIWQAASRFCTRAYSAFIKSQFLSCGDGTLFEPCVKLGGPHLINVGSGVYICEHGWLNAKDDKNDGQPTLHIGDGTYMGRFVQINAWRSVVIEKNVLIADRVFISDADHNYGDITQPIKQQGDSFGGEVMLKEGCWLGIGVVILPGVTIGRNSVVAANSVVTKSVPDFTVVAGIPAKVIKQIGGEQ